MMDGKSDEHKFHILMLALDAQYIMLAHVHRLLGVWNDGCHCVGLGTVLYCFVALGGSSHFCGQMTFAACTFIFVHFQSVGNRTSSSE